MEELLLDELANEISRYSLSDLRGDVGTSAFDACIQKIPCGAYPLAEWMKYVKYLAPCSGEPTTEREARQYLSAHTIPLERRGSKRK